MADSETTLDFQKLLRWVGSEEAALKLMVLSYGIAVDGELLAREIPDYLTKYRLKRARKNTSLVKGRLVDAETADVPFVPEEIFLHFNNFKSVVKLNYRPQSPFVIRIANSALCLENLTIKRSIPISLSEKAGTNLPGNLQTSRLIPILGSDRVAVLGYEGCSGWLSGKQCKFCDSCASRPDETSLIPSLNDLNTTFAGNIAAWLSEVEEPYFVKLSEAYKGILSRNIKPHFHLHVMAGNMTDVVAEWQYMLRLTRRLNKIKSVTEVDSYLNLLPPPDLALLDEAHKTGYRKLLFSLEVFGENYYRSVCPEKYELAGFEHFLTSMKRGIEIFGYGKVRCNFVLGAQPIETLKEGVVKLAEAGIPSDFTIFTPKRGTPWADKKPPALADVIDFTVFLHSTYKKYGFEGLYCSESSRSCVLNEMLHAG